MGLHTKGRRLALPENIWLGRKFLIVKNTLAYCGTELIMTAKSFIVKGPNVIKLFLSVYHECSK
jgi:hypothetical protein